MRVVIAAFGTWGDVRPSAVLAQALQNADYEVLLLAAEEFRQWVESRGIAFTGLSLNMQAVMASISFDRRHPIASLERMNSLAAPMLRLGREIAAVVREGDALLMSEGVLGLLNGIVEKVKPRLIHINLQPYVPTREFPSMILPVLPEWIPLRAAYNRAGGHLVRRMAWLMFGSLGNELRTKDFALPKQTRAKHTEMLDSSPSLLLVSRHVIPTPADWDSQHRITGYLFDDDSAWEAPQDLLNFLDSGEKPVYIGFGSMVDRQAEATTRLVLEAVRRSGKRAILLSGWAGVGALELPKEVFLLKYAPHSWLFPRMAAVIHHGGAGTTAAGLRAGVPSMVVPFQGDQPFWARRVYALGVGTKPIPRRKLTAEKLAAAIDEATSNRVMQENVTELSKKIAAEDGVGEAVKAVKEFLG